MATHEVEPPSAVAIFGPGIERARQFVAALAEEGEERGLIGPRELDKLWSRHVVNCGIVGQILGGGRVIDVGSGGGFPGVPLAIARPDVEFTLVEPMERRVMWLHEIVERLKLSNVSVYRARAEDAPFRQGADVVTARAVSALRTLIPLTAPLVRPGGELILMKGQGAQSEIDTARKQIASCHLRQIEVLSLGDGLLDQPTTVVRAKVGEAPTQTPTESFT